MESPEKSPKTKRSIALLRSWKVNGVEGQIWVFILQLTESQWKVRAVIIYEFFKAHSGTRQTMDWKGKKKWSCSGMKEDGCTVKALKFDNTSWLITIGTWLKQKKSINYHAQSYFGWDTFNKWLKNELE